jgi:hypothetical protein
MIAFDAGVIFSSVQAARLFNAICNNAQFITIIKLKNREPV